MPRVPSSRRPRRAPLRKTPVLKTPASSARLSGVNAARRKTLGVLAYAKSSQTVHAAEHHRPGGALARGFARGEDRTSSSVTRDRDVPCHGPEADEKRRAPAASRRASVSGKTVLATFDKTKV